MRVVHCKKEPYTHYIGRPGPFQNGHTHIGYSKIIPRDCETREEAIQKFEVDARKNHKLLELIRTLPEDAVLGCWCAPQACHGDVIMKLWQELRDGIITIA